MDKKNTDFAQIPNLVDDWGLSSAAFRLYAHIKRVAGDNGKCWEGQDSLAKICRQTTKTVVKAKQDLKKAGLISIDKVPYKGRKRDIISIVNIWPYVKKDVSEVREVLRGKSATDKTGLKKVLRGKSATDTGVKELPIQGENSYCNNNQGSISQEENPSIPAGAGQPTLSKNPFIARMQQDLDFYEVKPETIPNLTKEIKYIERMLARGFTEDQIFNAWGLKIMVCHGEFVSMAFVDKHIAEDHVSASSFLGFISTSSLISTIIARMRGQLGYPEKVKIDPIHNPAREAYHIEKMLARGFMENQIFDFWLSEYTNRHGQYVSMLWVNVHIGQGPGSQEPHYYLKRMQSALDSIGIAMTTSNPMRQVSFIKKLIDRGFTEDQIFDTWLTKVKERGKFVSMYYVYQQMVH